MWPTAGRSVLRRCLASNGTSSRKCQKRRRGLDAKAEDNYFTAKEIAEAASLPIHLFRDQAERNRKRVPHLMLVGNLRFSLPAILEWEMANSVVGSAVAAVSDEAESPAAPSEPAKRWHEIIREQDAARFDSAP